jgi:hypothetical protein
VNYLDHGNCRICEIEPAEPGGICASCKEFQSGMRLLDDEKKAKEAAAILVTCGILTAVILLGIIVWKVL